MFEVLHLDDHPHLVTWVPRRISSWFWKYCYEDMRTTLSDGVEDEENADETEFTLRLKVCGERLDTRYRLYANPEDFEEQILSVPPETVVLAVLDLAIGPDISVGTRLFSTIVTQRVSLAGRTLMLSAYPNLVCEQLKWAPNDPRLIVKARATPDLVVAEFVRRLAEHEQVGPGARKQLAQALKGANNDGSQSGR